MGDADRNADQLANAAHQVEAQYRTILESTIDGAWIIDRGGRILQVNDTYCHMSGYGKDELVGLHITELDAADKSHQAAAYVKSAIEKGTDRFESRHRRKDGTISDVAVGVKLLPEAGDGIIVLLRDITKRIQETSELRASEEKFRTFADQSQTGCYMADDLIFTYVNQSFAEIFGYTIEECLDGMHASQLIHPEDLPGFLERQRKRLAGELPVSQYHLRGVKKTGETINTVVFGNYMNYRGKATAIGSVIDTTKDMEMEQRLIRAQRMEAIGELAGGIAHDFNNILTPIVGMAELLGDDLPADSPEWENAGEILKAGKRGRDLVKQILTFSRQSDHIMMPTRIQRVIKEAIKLSRAMMPSSTDIHQDLKVDCGLVMGDPTQIHQVIMNLVTNAYHAVEDVGGKITVRLKEKALGSSDMPVAGLEPGRYAVLTVSDTGHGMPKDIRDRIFEPYFTTKGQGKGTGLGLAVVNGIVKEHGWPIRVQSQVGQGTTFQVFLPLMDKTDAPEPVGGIAACPQGSERILLVDDDASVLKLEKRMLERLGYQVTARNSSPDALMAFKAGPHGFDLVITDMTMPNMTGDRLARELIAIHPDIPILICTGFSEKMNRAKAAAIGVKGILRKPILKSDMAVTVRKVLDEAGSST